MMMHDFSLTNPNKLTQNNHEDQRLTLVRPLSAPRSRKIPEVRVRKDTLIFIFSILSCLISLECTLWEGFIWRMPKQAYTVPCRASHPRGQGAQVLCT